MLSEVTATQFGELMAFDMLREELREERRQRDAMETEALRGADEIRREYRGE